MEDSISSLVWDKLIMRNKFSFQGARQLHQDVIEFLHCINDDDCGSQKAKHLLEATKILSLPTANDNENHPTIKNISSMIFTDVETAPTVLASFGFKTLTLDDARTLLSRRLEMQR